MSMAMFVCVEPFSLMTCVSTSHTQMACGAPWHACMLSALNRRPRENVAGMWSSPLKDHRPRRLAVEPVARPKKKTT